MQPNQIFGVEEGYSLIEQQLPEVVRVQAKDIQLQAVDKTVMTLNLPSGQCKLGWAEGATFKTLTGVDATMMGRLTPITRQTCFDELLGNVSDPVVMKIRDGNILAVAPHTKEYPDYRTMLRRLVDRVKPRGISNVSIKGDTIGFGLVTERHQTPPSRVDDIVHEGIYCSFNGEVRAQPYNMRLACTNGMLSMKMDTATVIRDNTFESLVAQLLQRATSFTSEFTHLATKALPQGGAMVGRLSRMKLLNSQQVTRVTESLQGLGDEATEYDLINLITGFQHLRENDLSWLVAGGTSVSFLHSDHCSHCGSME